MPDARPVMLAAALVIAIAAIAAEGGFAGWRAELESWRATGAADPLSRTEHLVRAVASDPLLPRHRRALDEALARDLDTVGAKAVAARAPVEPVPRSRFVAALAGTGAGELAAPLASGVTPRNRLELEALDRESLVIAARGLAREGRCAEGMPLFDAFVARSSSSARVDLDVGRCWLELGAPEKALPYLDRARERETDSRWPRLARAQALLALQRLSEADAETASLVSDLPDFYYGWYARGDVLLRSNRPGEAAQAFGRAITLRGDEAVPYWLRYRLAEAHLAAGNFESSRREAEQVVVLRPEASGAWTILGRALLGAGQAAEAVHALERALELRNRERGDAFWNVYHLIEARLAARDVTRARTEGAKLVELRPDHSGAWALFGRTLLEAKKADEAVEAFERALARRRPGDRAVWTRLRLAEAHLNLGAADRSEQLTAEIVDEDPSFYHGWYVRARALTTLGRFGDAADAYRRALALRPANRWLERRIRALESRAAARS